MVSVVSAGLLDQRLQDHVPGARKGCYKTATITDEALPIKTSEVARALGPVKKNAASKENVLHNVQP